jgi:hypothetical protein
VQKGGFSKFYMSSVLLGTITRKKSVTSYINQKIK